MKIATKRDIRVREKMLAAANGNPRTVQRALKAAAGIRTSATGKLTDPRNTTLAARVSLGSVLGFIAREKEKVAE